MKHNLDDMHNFSRSHAILFVIICVLMAGECCYIAREQFRHNMDGSSRIIGIILIASPIIFHLVAVGLQGNVDTDFQYLLLRIFQGFDSTYLYLAVCSIIGFGISIYFSKQIKDES